MVETREEPPQKKPTTTTEDVVQHIGVGTPTSTYMDLAKEMNSPNNSPKDVLRILFNAFNKPTATVPAASFGTAPKPETESKQELPATVVGDIQVLDATLGGEVNPEAQLTTQEATTTLGKIITSDDETNLRDTLAKELVTGRGPLVFTLKRLAKTHGIQNITDLDPKTQARLYQGLVQLNHDLRVNAVRAGGVTTESVGKVIDKLKSI